MLPYEKVRRERLVKTAAESDPRFGCRPEERPAAQLLDYGIVNIDKPEGPTSHQVADYAKRIIGAKKAGHSGTLDPGVTGVLPVAMGRATRIVQLLLTAGKEYVAVMHVHDAVPEQQLRATLRRFEGRIEQLPPVRSAVKRALRVRSVYHLEVLEIAERDVLFTASVEAGTYIRKLIHDIGRELRCGAHMADLRRTRAGPFTEESLVTLQDFADAVHYFRDGNDKMLLRCMQPVERAVEHLPKVWVLDAAVETLCHGSDLFLPGISAFHSGIVAGHTVALMTLKEELIGYGTARCTSGEMVAPHGLAVKSEKIFMLPGTYPKATA